MSGELLHVSHVGIKESEDGNIATMTLGGINVNAAALIGLIGQEVILETASNQSFHGVLVEVKVKEGEAGPETTVKVTGGPGLHGLVGNNAAVEAAQVPLPIGPVQKAVEKLRPKKGSGIDSVTISNKDTSVTLRAKEEVEKVIDRAVAGAKKDRGDVPAAPAEEPKFPRPSEMPDLENF